MFNAMSASLILADKTNRGRSVSQQYNLAVTGHHIFSREEPSQTGYSSNYTQIPLFLASIGGRYEPSFKISLMV
jgi:hypothetical protein